MSTDTEQRFWSKVQKAGPDECWPWTGGKSVFGYGNFRWNGRQGPAHRYSCELAIGRPVVKGEYVLHSCDNPPCVNPAHLRVGTQSENIQDSWDRKRRKMRDISGDKNPWATHPHRMPSGERVNTAILVESQVREIWRRVLDGQSGTQISKALGVNLQTVRQIAQGRSWQRLEGAPSPEELRAGGQRNKTIMTPEKCEEALAMLARGDTIVSVARHFGVSTAPISNLKNHGKTWVPKP